MKPQEHNRPLRQQRPIPLRCHPSITILPVRRPNPSRTIPLPRRKFRHAHRLPFLLLQPHGLGVHQPDEHGGRVQGAGAGPGRHHADGAAAHRHAAEQRLVGPRREPGVLQLELHGAERAR